MLRLLVTGHEGYLGSVLVPMFQAAGHEVVGLDAGFFAACRFPSGGPEARCPALARDLRDVGHHDLVGFDAVVHLAALSNDPLGDLDPGLTYEINLAASLRLAELAKAAGVERFVFSSSCSNYGAAGEAFLTEEAAFNPVTPYAVSKVKLEQELRRLADESFSPTFLRNATAYGVSPRLRVDLVLNNLMAWAVTTGRIRLQSDGTPWRPIVHVEDIGRAFLAVLGAPRERVHNQAFNVGATNENYQIRELAQIVGETVPGCTVEFAEGAGPDPRNYRVDCSKLAATFPDLGFAWTARRGAEQLHRAYREAGLTFEEFDGPRYKRLARIRQLLAAGGLDQKLRWIAAGEAVSAAVPSAS